MGLVAELHLRPRKDVLGLGLVWGDGGEDVER